MVKSLLWWVMSSASALLSFFFFIMGIDLCRAAYKLDQPHQFILTFFASNLIILISVVFFAGVVVRMVARLRRGQSPHGGKQQRLVPDASQSKDHSAS